MTEALRKIPAEKVARALATVTTLLLVSLHVVFATHAGALWRDEVNSLEVATMRTLSEMWANLSFDSFPVLFFLLLRVVAGVPSVASDTELRIFGFGIGLLLIGVLWLNARWLGFGFPVLSLAVIGFNPMIIRYGDSIRAYGLGMVVMLFSLGAIWRLTEAYSRRRVAIAVVAALLSVHVLYFNATLLFAVCMGGVAVTVCARKYAQATAILAVGATAAVSLVPYWPVIQRVQSMNFMWKVDFNTSLLWRNLAHTLGSHSSLALWLCVAIFGAGLCGGIWTLLRKPSREDQPACKSLLLFAVVTLLVGVVGYTIFLHALSYHTRPWYYVVIIAFAGMCLEMIFASLSKRRWLVLARSAFALIFVGTVAYPTWETLGIRQTNIDRIALELERRAQAEDLIVINTWNFGISFQHYYHGAARFETVPPVKDLRSHRVDLVKEQMMSPDPIASVLQQAQATLRAGRTVWLIGRLDFLEPGESPLSVPPGFDGPKGWVGGDFYKAWSEQLGSFFQQNAINIVRAPRMKQPIMGYEDLELNVIRGWREEPLAALQ